MSTFTAFEKYIERLKQIRRFSTPSLDGIRNADAYNHRLRENFDTYQLLKSVQEKEVQ